MNNYVVKNCPAVTKDISLCYGTYKDSKTITSCKKLDNSKCVIKQIIEKCNDAIKIYDNDEFYEDDQDYFMGQSHFAQNILELFEIAEIEESEA